MSADLEMPPREVHAGEMAAQARAVLDFWFAMPADRHFAKDDALDREIAARFGALRDHVYATDAHGWRDTPETLLAAIILLDQFSRNIHRDDPRAYEADDLAATLTLRAIDRGWDAAMPAEQRHFLYMPLMHAEDMPLQTLGLEKFATLGDADTLAFAKEHADAIRRFGRFPTRNAVLGRATTVQEQAWMDANHPAW